MAELLLIAVDLASLAWLILPITQGRNWARFVYVPVFLFRFLVLLELPTLARVSGSELYFNVSLGLLLVQMLIRLFALCLLFFGSGAAWFEQKGKPT